MGTYSASTITEIVDNINQLDISFPKQEGILRRKQPYWIKTIF